MLLLSVYSLFYNQNEAYTCPYFTIRPWHTDLSPYTEAIALTGSINIPTIYQQFSYVFVARVIPPLVTNELTGFPIYAYKTA